MYVITESMKPIEARFRELVSEASSESKLMMAGVYGSQLCGLDEHDSDIDLLAVEWPTVEGLLMEEPGKGLRQIGGNHVRFISVSELYGYFRNSEVWTIHPFTTAHSARYFAECCSVVQLNIGTAADDSSSALRRSIASDLFAKGSGDLIRMMTPSQRDPEGFRKCGYDPKSAASAFKEFLFCSRVMDAAEGTPLGDIMWLGGNPLARPYFEMRRETIDREETKKILSEQESDLKRRLFADSGGDRSPILDEPESSANLIAALVLATEACIKEK